MTLDSPAWFALRHSVEKQTYDLLEEHGATGWKVVFDKATNRAGRCTYDTKTISYSVIYLLHGTEAQRINTIRHEVAHALVGPGYGHGYAWKRKFLLLGGDGSRTTHIALPSEVVKSNFLWVGACPTCDAQTGQQRAPQSVWACTACPESIPSIERIFRWSKRGVPVAPLEVSARYADKYSYIASKYA